jgi:hypothetical protein
MTHRVNSLGQPIGAALSDWRPPQLPPREPMGGRHCTVEPLNVERHAAELYAAVSLDREGRNWTYVPSGPLEDSGAYLAWLEKGQPAPIRCFTPSSMRRERRLAPPRTSAWIPPTA